MKRPIIAAVILLSTVLSAHATYMYRYHDVRNKHQHDSNAVATQKCDPYHQQAYESAEFNACMRSLGWRFYRVDHIRAAPDSAPDDDYQSNDSPSPSAPPAILDISTPAPAYEPPAPVDIHPFCPNTIC